jgi:coenzyme F420-reducing hydrogenase alpha subunit
MIKMNIDTSDMKRLAAQLREFTSAAEREAQDVMVELSDKTNRSFDNKMLSLVYDKYSPYKYKRTDHLRGKDGSRVEEMKIDGSVSSYSFQIDENSRDRKGETWYNKAERVESGDLRGSAPERPFIEETQNDLKKGLKEAEIKYMAKIRMLLNRR